MTTNEALIERVARAIGEAHFRDEGYGASALPKMIEDCWPNFSKQARAAIAALTPPAAAEGEVTQAQELVSVMEGMWEMMRHAPDCGPGCTCNYEPLAARARDLLPFRLAHAAPKVAGVGDGYVLVPREPTEAMVDRFVSRALCVSVHGEGGWSNYAREQSRFLAAAPSAPGSGEG